MKRMVAAIDDCAAVVFSGTAVERVVSWHDGCTADHVSRESGSLRETAYVPETL